MDKGTVKFCGFLSLKTEKNEKQWKICKHFKLYTEKSIREVSIRHIFLNFIDFFT